MQWLTLTRNPSGKVCILTCQMYIIRQKSVKALSDNLFLLPICRHHTNLVSLSLFNSPLISDKGLQPLTGKLLVTLIFYGCSFERFDGCSFELYCCIVEINVFTTYLLELFDGCQASTISF